MKKLYLLSDYKNFFGSKWGSKPYRSGFDIEELNILFKKNGYESEVLNFSNVQHLEKIEGQLFLYTSSEDLGYHYKSYIEDVILFLEQKGGIVIPRYNFLRANNNKSFMELFRKNFSDATINSLKSFSVGTLEELEQSIDRFSFPVVLKESEGAMSKGVYLAKDKKELIRFAKMISRTRYRLAEIKDYLRPYKHEGYKKESKFREKFVIQEYLPNLNNDWKVLVYYDKLFVLERGVPKNDFRASGSHYNYLPGSKTKLPNGFLDFAVSIRKEFNVPNISLDIVYAGRSFHLIEFQAVYYGTSTYNMSDIHYEMHGDGWIQKEIMGSIEEYYAESIISYLDEVLMR